jgi:hypothetical protein
MGHIMSDARQPSVDELAAGPIDDFDGAVLRQTAVMFDALDPVPGGLVERINFGLTLEALHAEVAVLQRGGILTGVRAEAGQGLQTVTFTSSLLTMMITATPTSADQVRIDGWIAPGRRMSVELRAGAQRGDTMSDDDGRFVFDDVTRGFVQFVLRPDDDESHAVVTPALDI